MFAALFEGIADLCTRTFILLRVVALNAVLLDIGGLVVIGVLYVLLPLIAVFVLGRLLYILIVKASSIAGVGISAAQSDEDLDDVFGIAGYEYDPKQDVFYSTLDSWQKKFGYCRLYDEALAPLSMIIDCEPITFECYGKKWMIEFWKGQYTLNTGGEIGLYQEVADLGLTKFDGSFYISVKDEDMMYMAFSLKKNGKELFYREDKHWWLTGFKMGEFSQPSELTMDIAIQFNDLNMCYSFINGLLNVGYTEDEIVKLGNKVYFTFGKPRTEQPFTRTRFTDWIIQKKNKLMCTKYREATANYASIDEKLTALKNNKPSLYNKAVNVGKGKKVYKAYDRIKRSIN